jgi:hypothetical protein
MKKSSLSLARDSFDNRASTRKSQRSFLEIPHTETLQSCYMVTTYKVTECNADASVSHLNFELNKARYQVEHTFGLLKGRFQVFEKPLRSAGKDLPFSVCLIASICVIHNFLIDARDTVPEVDVLRAAAEQNGGVVEDDVDEEIGSAGEQNYEGVTREAFVRRRLVVDGYMKRMKPKE